jgi:hypothetical protein
VYITRGFTAIRVGGEGTYIGAIVFPILAIVFGFVTWRMIRSIRK